MAEAASVRIRIGHSPDPDDAFLFYALTHGRIPLPGIAVTHQLEGIERLNERALAGELEMTAISLAAYPYCADRYLLLTTGASVGEGYGPVVVAKRPMGIGDLRRAKVAVPGRMTTAALLLQMAARPAATEVVPFDRILAAVEEGRADAGLLIHEGQLTYLDTSLKKVLDLGEWWQAQTRLPLPLGINVIRRDLGPELIARVAAAFKEGLDYAFAHREEALRYAQQYSRGLDWKRTDRFVGMYVNRWALDCRPDAAAAMQQLLDRAAQEGLVPRRVAVEFAGDGGR